MSLRVQSDWKHSPRCVRSSGSCSSFPAAAPLQLTWKSDSDMTLVTEQTRVKLKVFSTGRYSLERCAKGFVFPYKCYSDQAVPLLPQEKKKTCSIKIFTCGTNCILTELIIDPNLTWKLTGGGGFFGSILTTLDSTFGGGRKLFFPT